MKVNDIAYLIKASCTCRYKVVHLGLVETTLQRGVYVDFEDYVERHVTDWKVDLKTFITRVGGVIGVGKNLLWIVILSLTSLVSLLSLAKQFLKI